MKMKLERSTDPIENIANITGHSIFLAGPTPRSTKIESWRPWAIYRLFEQTEHKGLHYDGTVFVPEPFGGDKKQQMEWEWAALHKATVIVCWVDRELEHMPAFTTNVEFGFYVNSGRLIYGRPNSAPKCEYLDWMYEKVTGRKPIAILDDLLIEATQFGRVH